MFAAVTNTKSYGGGFLVSPHARIDDGQLDICIVKGSDRVRLLRNFPRILKGTHTALPEVVMATSSWVRIESPTAPCSVSLDGELPIQTTPLDIVCEARALQVLVPPHVSQVFAQEHVSQVFAQEQVSWLTTTMS
jgi:diacylglycerol kinase family enzyme